MSADFVLFILILVAGFYMAWNIGANDVANAVGTSVGSGALTLKQAVIIAAIFEFSGAYFFGSHVTDMIQEGLVNPHVFSQSPMIFVFGMLSALIAAGMWLQIASYFGWPVSTTHSIVGAVVGFGLIVGGFTSIYWGNVFYIASAWILSPLAGGFLSYLAFNILRKRIFYAPCPVTAAKCLIPKIVFVFACALTVIVAFNGLKNMDLELSIIESIGLSLFCGLIASLISYLCLQRVKTPSNELQVIPDQNAPASQSLEKAMSNLKQARKETSGEMAYSLTQLLLEVEKINKKIQQKKMFGSSDYNTVEKMFGYLQIMSACSMAFAHGANDVANAIGPLSAAINVLTSGTISQQALPVPTWTLALGGVGIVIGLSTWGWRVIETIGKKITELTPSRGFAAEFGAALTIVFASRLGLPVSTTHTLVGSVLGVGMARGIEALDLSTTRDILISWVITVPAGATLSIICFYILDALFKGILT